MKNLKLGTNFAIFIIFFGVAALDAVQTQNWLRVAFWIAIGAVFLWADFFDGNPTSKNHVGNVLISDDAR